MSVNGGRARADILITGGSLANVYTGELLPGVDVAIQGPKIVYVGPRGEALAGPDTLVISAEGRVVSPGFIDGHTHYDFLLPIEEYVRYAALTGTTTIVTELSAVANAVGYEAAVAYLRRFALQPINVYGLAPVMVPPDPQVETGRPMVPELVQFLLARSDILGVGECYWPRVLVRDPEVEGCLKAAVEGKKTVEGHSAGLKGPGLVDYVAQGVSSCHEPISEGEVLERLRLGLYVMIREGSIRRELENVAAIAAQPLDFRRLCLVSDGIFPPDLVRGMGMAAIVQKAVDLGFAPLKAIQMATLNVAEHFGLAGLTGGVAPGKQADVLVLRSLREIVPEYVIARGKVVAVGGKVAQTDPLSPCFSPELFPPLRLPRRFSAEDFAVKGGDNGRARVRAVGIKSDLITAEELVEVPCNGGVVLGDESQDVIKVAVIARHLPGGMFAGFVHGFGLRYGACATSLTWDACNVLVLGASDHDMAAAVNRLAEIGGGFVYVQGGKVAAEVPLPVGGIISLEPAAELAKQIETFEAELKRAGVALGRPFLTLQVLTFVVLPYLRISDRGLVDVRRRQLVGLFV